MTEGLFLSDLGHFVQCAYEDGWIPVRCTNDHELIRMRDEHPYATGHGVLVIYRTSSTKRRWKSQGWNLTVTSRAQSAPELWSRWLARKESLKRRDDAALAKLNEVDDE